MNSRNILLALAVLQVATASAQTVDNLPTLRIVGGSEDHAQVSTRDLGEQTSFSARELESYTPLSTDLVLRQVPGFSLFRRSSSVVSNPTTHGVSLRGTGPSGASRTVVLLDGVPINDPFGGWVQWGRLPLDSIERITVQENWGANHWSYLGLGNVIDVQTKVPATNTVSSRISAGSRETVDAHLAASAVEAPLKYSVGGRYFKTDGYKIVAPEDRGPIDIDADAASKVGYGKVWYNLSEDNVMYGTWNVFDEDRGNGTPLTGNESRSYSASTGGVFKLPGGRQVRSGAFFVHSDFESTFSSQAPDRASEIPALDQNDVPADQVGVQADWSTVNDRHYLEFGSDALWRQGETNEEFRFVEDDFQKERTAGAEQIALGAYVFSRFRVAPNLLLDSFLRLNGWENLDLYRRETDRATRALERAEETNDSFSAFLEPRLQLTYELTDVYRIRSAAIRGMRMPTPNELVRPFRVRNDITEANPGLKHEQLLGFDLAFEADDDRLDWSLLGFFNLLQDSIANVTVGDGPGMIEPCGFVPEGGLCKQRRNLGTVWVPGAQAAVSYRVNLPLKLGASYLFTYSDIKDQGDASGLTRNALPQLPRHQVALNTTYETDRYRIFLQGRYLSSQFEDDANTLKLSPFFTADTSVSIPWDKDGALFVTVENLFGKRYQVGKTNEGVETVGPPLTLMAGAAIQF